MQASCNSSWYVKHLKVSRKIAALTSLTCTPWSPALGSDTICSTADAQGSMPPPPPKPPAGAAACCCCCCCQLLAAGGALKPPPKPPASLLTACGFGVV